ncbi:MAG: tetratricopeptide repeat protein [Duncaniella sp.]|uniref:tetratricopeptide repeat protein n=1 Tax=Duncaniella sp. TaxID=2518496 RepID=UPI0023D63466|nr:tetratricopeptide repeat protein [Duncaniella sp.]MDE6089325.1 tetratricopeptide repeat protein [Duncaniella sp.]
MAQDYRILISEGKIEAALSVLDDLIKLSPDDDRLLFERGKLRWRIGDRAGATGDYAKASMINPESPAAKALEQARDIADFFNPDLYNP